MGSHMTICVADTPFELLQIHFPLDLAHHCHMWLGYDEVGCSLEPECLVDRYSLHVVCYLCEEDRIIISINDSQILIEID